MLCKDNKHRIIAVLPGRSAEIITRMKVHYEKFT